MRNVAPSLIVKGCLFRSSSEPGLVRSMTMSGRPSTSRPRERMITAEGFFPFAEGFVVLVCLFFWSLEVEVEGGSDQGKYNVGGEGEVRFKQVKLTEAGEGDKRPSA
ncbi:hypothetical protein KC327_g33 [Hortaea werneckii]|nr:hypothetical protein KC327_g33 [Hortaea werneckii]